MCARFWFVAAAVGLVACNNEEDPVGDTDSDLPVDTQDEVEDVLVRFRVGGFEGTTPKALAGARCEWTRRNGEPWGVPVADTSDQDGFCYLEVEGDRDTLTVRVSLDNHIDVLAAGFPVRAFDEERPEQTTTGVVMFTGAQADAFYQAAQQTRDPSRGYVVGVATWRPTGEGVIQPVGCVRISSPDTTPGFSRYLGQPLNRDTTDPRTGVWLGFDVSPGNHEFVAAIDDGPTIRSRVPVLANTFTNIPLFFEMERNPTPAGCE